MIKAEKISNILTEKVTQPIDYTSGAPAGSIVTFLKKILKRNGWIYYLLVRVLSPVFVHPANERKIKNILDQYNDNSIVLNVGSGPQYFMGRKDILNLDIFKFDEVDILVAGKGLPLKDNCADFIISIAALEHISDYRATMNEMYRVVKPGGRGLFFVPFMQPYHGAPDDYQRWTISGCNTLVRPFKMKDSWIGGGPTSGLLWVLQEWIAITFSFGSKFLQEFILYLLMVLTFPLKWLDLILIYHPNANKIASGFYMYVEKE